MKGCGTACGIEAALLLELLLGAEDGGVLCDALPAGVPCGVRPGGGASGGGRHADGSCPGGAEERSYSAVEALRIEEMDAAALKELVRRASQRLRELETASCEAAAKAVTGIRVTRGGRIFLETDGSVDGSTSGSGGVSVDGSTSGSVTFSSREIVMKPLCKVLFLLFLRHPEGMRFKEISAYEDEMLELYGMVSRRDDVDAMRSSIRRICDMDSNCLNTHRSQLGRALARFADGAALESLLIGGSRAGVRRITADRIHVIWE